MNWISLWSGHWARGKGERFGCSVERCSWAKTKPSNVLVEQATWQHPLTENCGRADVSVWRNILPVILCKFCKWIWGQSINMSNSWFKHVQAALRTKKDFESIKSACFKTLTQPRRQQIVNRQCGTLMSVGDLRPCAWWRGDPSGEQGMFQSFAAPCGAANQTFEVRSLAQPHSLVENPLKLLNLIVIKGILSIRVHLSFIGIESQKKVSKTLLKADVWNMRHAVVVCHAKSLSIKIDRVVQVIRDHHYPKSKRQKVVGKSSSSDSIPTSKFRTPRTTKKRLKYQKPC